MDEQLPLFPVWPVLTDDEIMTVLAKPYDDQLQYAAYAVPPQVEEVVHRTFCGT